jgi:hypothetical protein
MVAAILAFMVGASAAVCPPQPETQPANFLQVDGIEEFNVDFALQWTDSAAVLFLQPFDAVVLHIGTPTAVLDVFIFSDPAMNRLTIWTCMMGVHQTREILAIAEYEGEDADGLAAPSGIATNAIGRIFDPDNDVIYLADRGNDRILELGFNPDESEKPLFMNRSFGEGVLEWPVDVAVSEYKDQKPEQADLYVVDWGHQPNAGELVRFDKDGNYEYDSHYIYFSDMQTPIFELFRPMSVACFPDTLEGITHIYLTEAASNPLIQLVSTTDEPPRFADAEDLEMRPGFWQPGGIAFDDFGRVYIANPGAGFVQAYGPYMRCRYSPITEPGGRGIQTSYPANIVIDTYGGSCEALLLEKYNRQTGLKTFFIVNGSQGLRQERGFRAQGMVAKPAAKPQEQLPLVYSLRDIYPNPFNSECKIRFAVPERARVVIDIFDILGRKVTRLTDEEFDPGEHSVTFRAGDLSSGTYMLKMSAGSYRQIKPFVILK